LTFESFISNEFHTTFDCLFDIFVISMLGSRKVSGFTLSFIYRIEMDNCVKIIIHNGLKLFFPHLKEHPM